MKWNNINDQGLTVWREKLNNEKIGEYGKKGSNNNNG
jgi:hypothetical protein